MRTIMLPSILDVTARNFNMKNESVRLYELGSVYTPVDGAKLPNERKILSAAAYGDLDFFDVKGAVETLAEGLRISA